MIDRILPGTRALSLCLILANVVHPTTAHAVSCKTQSQLTSAERDALSSAARSMITQVQSGDVQGLQAAAIPAVAADFNDISASVQTLKPLVHQATVTVNSLYVLDATSVTGGRIDFFCGSPVVALNFSDLPPGQYAFVIVHATGVPDPQQIALVLSMSPNNHWMLGGFFSRPMTLANHDGVWYWASARKFAEKQMNWDAWFYYRMAAYFLTPVDFLSSPNLDKLQREQQQLKPANLPTAQQPLTLSAQGASFQITNLDTTTTFGPLDLEVHYAPNQTQASELRDPPTARKQVTAVMTALLSLHPELQDAFHGIWIHADQGTASLFTLELPMDQIALEGKPASLNANPTLR